MSVTSKRLLIAKKLELLEAALKLMDNGRRWTKGARRKERNAQGTYVGSAYCMLGSLDEASSQLKVNGDAKDHAVRALKPHLAGGSVPSFNDNKKTVWGNVAEVYKRAINQTKEELKRAL